MDIKKAVLKEHSKAQASKIIKYIGNDPERFKALVEVFLAGPYRVTQRAAWPLSFSVENHPELIKPHLKALLNYLSKPGIHDAVKRNTVRLLQFIEIPKPLQGRVSQICFQYLSDNKEPIAIRVFSMTVLGHIARQNPELSNELMIIIEDLVPYSSPAFTARARKVLTLLK